MDAEARRWPSPLMRDGAQVLATPAPDSASPPRRAHPWALVWGLGRTPLLLLVVFALREPILDWVERLFDIVWITERVVDVMSTPLARLVLLVGVLAGLTVVWRLTRNLPPWRGWLARTGLGAALILAVVEAGGASRWLALGLSCVLMFNALPRQALDAGVLGRVLFWAVRAVPLFGEVLLTRRYVAWLARSAGANPTERSLGSEVFAGLAAAVALVLLVNGQAFAALERNVRAGPEVTLMASGDFNSLQLDSAGGALFASGHGLARVTRYDLATGVAQETDADSGHAQDVAFDPEARELLVYNAEQQAVMIFDADTLSLRRTLPTPELSPGDVLIGYDRKAILLSSEADGQVGAPIVVLDRASGRVVDLRPEEAGGVLRRPSTSVVYLSFFRRDRGVLAYDLERRKYVAAGSTGERMDRMAYDGQRRELLAPAPADGRVLRFDATTLKPKPPLRGVFGARGIALDPVRDVMLLGSFATGRVSVVRLSDNRILKSWYVGPWLRTITADPIRGRAFISSKGALYRLDYAAGLS